MWEIWEGTFSISAEEGVPGVLWLALPYGCLSAGTPPAVDDGCETITDVKKLDAEDVIQPNRVFNTSLSETQQMLLKTQQFLEDQQLNGIGVEAEDRSISYDFRYFKSSQQFKVSGAWCLPGCSPAGADSSVVRLNWNDCHIISEEESVANNNHHISSSHNFVPFASPSVLSQSSSAPPPEPCHTQEYTDEQQQNTPATTAAVSAATATDGDQAPTQARCKRRRLLHLGDLQCGGFFQDWKLEWTLNCVSEGDLEAVAVCSDDSSIVSEEEMEESEGDSDASSSDDSSASDGREEVVCLYGDEIPTSDWARSGCVKLRRRQMPSSAMVGSFNAFHTLFLKEVAQGSLGTPSGSVGTGMSAFSSHSSSVFSRATSSTSGSSFSSRHNSSRSFSSRNFFSTDVFRRFLYYLHLVQSRRLRALLRRKSELGGSLSSLTQAISSDSASSALTLSPGVSAGLVGTKATRDRQLADSKNVGRQSHVIAWSPQPVPSFSAPVLTYRNTLTSRSRIETMHLVRTPLRYLCLLWAINRQRLLDNSDETATTTSRKKSRKRSANKQEQKKQAVKGLTLGGLERSLLGRVIEYLYAQPTPINQRDSSVRSEIDKRQSGKESTAQKDASPVPVVVQCTLCSLAVQHASTNLWIEAERAPDYISVEDILDPLTGLIGLQLRYGGAIVHGAKLCAVGDTARDGAICVLLQWEHNTDSLRQTKPHRGNLRLDIVPQAGGETAIVNGIVGAVRFPGEGYILVRGVNDAAGSVHGRDFPLFVDNPSWDSETRISRDPNRPCAHILNTDALYAPNNLSFIFGFRCTDETDGLFYPAFLGRSAQLYDLLVTCIPPTTETADFSDDDDVIPVESVHPADVVPVKEKSVKPKPPLAATAARAFHAVTNPPPPHLAPRSSSVSPPHLEHTSNGCSFHELMLASKDIPVPTPHVHVDANDMSPFDENDNDRPLKHVPFEEPRLVDQATDQPDDNANSQPASVYKTEPEPLPSASGSGQQQHQQPDVLSDNEMGMDSRSFTDDGSPLLLREGSQRIDWGDNDDVGEKVLAAAAAASAAPATHSDRNNAAESEVGDPSHLCLVCLTEPRDYACYPCGHRVLCQGCYHRVEGKGKNSHMDDDAEGGDEVAVTMHRCPVCRAHIELWLRIFM